MLLTGSNGLSLVLLALAALFLPACAQVMNGVQALKGSTAGGTYLTIWGSGFKLNKQGQINVFVGSSVCPIVGYFSSDSTLVCYTPPGIVG